MPNCQAVECLLNKTSNISVGSLPVHRKMCPSHQWKCVGNSGGHEYVGLVSQSKRLKAVDMSFSNMNQTNRSFILQQFQKNHYKLIC